MSGMTENQYDHVREQLEIIRRLIQGNGRPGLVQDVAKLQADASNMGDDVRSLQAKNEAQTRWLLASLFTTLVTITGTLLAYILK